MTNALCNLNSKVFSSNVCFEYPSFEIAAMPDSKGIKQFEVAARTCYRSESKITKDISSGENLLNRILKHDHLAMLEFLPDLVVKIRTNRGCCYDGETEVLTKGGWKLFSKLDGTEEFACLSDSGDLVWHKATDYIEKDWDGDLLHFESTSIDIMVTPNHNMWVNDYRKRGRIEDKWKFIEAQNLKTGAYKFRKDANWCGKKQKIHIPAHQRLSEKFPEINFNYEETSDFFELLGIWVGDGHFNRSTEHGGGNITISQTKPTGKKRIEYLCEKLNLRWSYSSPNYRIDNARLLRAVENLFGSCNKPNRRVPDIIFDADKDQIQRFLDGLVLADGNTHKTNGHIVIYIGLSEDFAGDIQRLYLQAGLCANVRKIKPTERGSINGIPVKADKETFIVSVHGKKRKIHHFLKRSAKSYGSKIKYKGKVYCVTVPHHRLYVRRNGKACWCGNSHELVRHRMCSFAQESTRYVKYDLVPFLLPWWSTATHLYESPQIVKNSLFISSCLSSAQFYRERVISGCSAQEARGSLNNDLATYINVKANIREWLHIFSLRSAKESHPDMRLLVCGIACWLNENNPLFNRIFNHYQPIKHNITWFKNNFFIELLEGAQYIINYVDADTGTDACDQWEK